MSLQALTRAREISRGVERQRHAAYSLAGNANSAAAERNGANVFIAIAIAIVHRPAILNGRRLVSAWLRFDDTFVRSRARTLATAVTTSAESTNEPRMVARMVVVLILGGGGASVSVFGFEWRFEWK